MYNLARAAEAGWKGPVADALDFEVVSNLGGRVPEERARANRANRANPGRLTPGARRGEFFMPQSQRCSRRRCKEGWIGPVRESAGALGKERGGRGMNGTGFANLLPT